MLAPGAHGLAWPVDLEQRAAQVQDDLLASLDVTERKQLRALLDKVLDGHPAQPA